MMGDAGATMSVPRTVFGAGAGGDEVVVWTHKMFDYTRNFCYFAN